MTATTTAAPVVTRARVGWGDLLWLTWRQHRWTVVGTAVVAAGLAALMLGMAWHIDATGTDDHELLGRLGYHGLSQMAVFLPTLLGLLFAVFWTAPLLSREYEQRTHLVVWSQDVTPARWLVGKVVLLGVPVVALAAGLGLASIKIMNSVNAVTSDYVPFRPFGTTAFEAAPQVQIGYALFGFALGLALSALTRRTVLSMGLALGVFFVVRAAVAGAWRPYFQAPLRKVEPYDVDNRWRSSDDGSWTVNGGIADAAGNEVDFPGGACSGTRTANDFERCMADQGIVSYFSDYHPADRLVPFQLFESAIFVVLAAGLLALAFAWVRRAHRV